MTHVLELASSEDVAAIRELVEAAYRPYIMRLGVEPGPLRDDYAALVAGKAVRILRDEQGLSALLVLIPQEDAMLLDNVAVAPWAQGRGMGRWLMAQAEAEAIVQGFSTIRLYTHVLMTENQALYRGLGYRETRRVTERGLDRVYMEKALDNRAGP